MTDSQDKIDFQVGFLIECLKTAIATEHWGRVKRIVANASEQFDADDCGRLVR